MVHRVLSRNTRRKREGRSVEECRSNLSEAIALILEDRREDGLRGVSIL
jgi:hypothetical protein